MLDLHGKQGGSPFFEGILLSYLAYFEEYPAVPQGGTGNALAIPVQISRCKI